MVRWPEGLEEDLDFLPNSFGDVGPRWGWVIAKLGIAIARTKAQTGIDIPNRFIGYTF
jgi:hypothetical protein